MEANMRWWILALALVACNGDDTDVDTDTNDTDTETGCEGLPEAACGEVEGCVGIEGTPINGALQFAGCALDPGGCDDVITTAQAPDGTCWDFTDSCVPDGWSGTAGTCADNL